MTTQLSENASYVLGAIRRQRQYDPKTNFTPKIYRDLTGLTTRQVTAALKELRSSKYVRSGDALTAKAWEGFSV